MSVGFPGDYGGDGAAGAKIAAEANGIDFTNVETAPGQEAQAGAISADRQAASPTSSSSAPARPRPR